MLESIFNSPLFSGSQETSGAHTSGYAAMPESERKGAPPFPVVVPPTKGESTSLNVAERFAQSESFSLELRTKEGDRVTITFDHASAYQSSLSASRDGSGSSAAYSVSRAERSSFQFSIEGDLNDDERDAIHNLVQDMSMIADDFFSGDLQSAFDQASAFRMDRTHLASMSLELKQSMQYSVAAAYQEVQQAAEGGSQAPGQRLGHMMGMLQQQQNAPELGFIDQVRSLQQQLLESLVQHDTRYRDADDDSKQNYNDHLARLGSLLN
jgi:hypothetical protein